MTQSPNIPEAPGPGLGGRHSGETDSVNLGNGNRPRRADRRAGVGVTIVRSSQAKLATR